MNENGRIYIKEKDCTVGSYTIPSKCDTREQSQY